MTSTSEVPFVPVEALDTPPPGNPMAVARHLAPAWHTPDKLLTLRHWRGSWMSWQGPDWRELDPQEVRAMLYPMLEHATYLHTTTKGEIEVRNWAPTARKINDLMDAVAAITHLPPTVDAPVWIDSLARVGTRSTPLWVLSTRTEETAGHEDQIRNGSSKSHNGADRVPTRASHDGVDDETPIVACRNGLLSVTGRQLLPHSAAFFNLVSVDLDYDPHATAPAWLDFLGKLWPDDPSSINALQEWFGYVISGRTDQQKILLTVGPTRSGKGTIARVLGQLVGKGNVAGPTLASLATNFGLESLLARSLAVISDARLAGREGPQVVERLLTISGEDTIDVDRKYRPAWTGKLPTRLMILSNELPHFGDASGAIVNRFIVLTMTASWLGREDRTLADKLTAELPGILNWALDGLARLDAQGRFTVPESSEQAVVTMQDSASPMGAFVRTSCDTGPTCEATVDELWEAWKTWCEDSGMRSGTRQLFGRNLQAVIPQVKVTQPRVDGKRVRYYVGVALKPDAWSSEKPTCAACRQPMTVVTPGQTHHPMCEPE
ncbi:DNA primase family protein [Nonomuraea polychroma]|uniref:DNA primase family protein n=1 Tax=Nonomuraea polychroma TaxID=46176 RepID=UPI003D8EEE15